MARRSHTGGWTGELDAAKRVLIDDTKKCVASELETIAIANEAFAVWNASEVGAPPSLPDCLGGSTVTVAGGWRAVQTHCLGHNCRDKG